MTFLSKHFSKKGVCISGAAPSIGLNSGLGVGTGTTFGTGTGTFGSGASGTGLFGGTGGTGATGLGTGLGTGVFAGSFFLLPNQPVQTSCDIMAIFVIVVLAR